MVSFPFLRFISLVFIFVTYSILLFAHNVVNMNNDLSGLAQVFSSKAGGGN